MKSRISKEVRETVFKNPIVHIACDTRGSSKRLVAAVKEGLDCLGVESIDHGLLSTPQLHYMTANHEKNYTSPKMSAIKKFTILTYLYETLSK